MSEASATRAVSRGSPAGHTEVGEPGAARRTVVVLAPGRSGTSTVSGILGILGVDMGETEWAGQDQYNVKGYFEDQEFLRLNEKILVDAGGDWQDPPSRDEIARSGARFDDTIAALVAERPPLWGWKDPRTALTFELFLPHLSDPQLVVVTRNPYHVAASLERREDHMSLLDGLRLTWMYEERILETLTEHPELPHVVVAYEDVIADPVAEARRLAEFLDLPFTPATERRVHDLVLSPGEIEREKRELNDRLEDEAQRQLREIYRSRTWRALHRLQRLKRRIPLLRRI